MVVGIRGTAWSHLLFLMLVSAARFMSPGKCSSTSPSCPTHKQQQQQQQQWQPSTAAATTAAKAAGEGECYMRLPFSKRTHLMS
jgi:hypothetical protein